MLITFLIKIKLVQQAYAHSASDSSPCVEAAHPYATRGCRTPVDLVDTKAESSGTIHKLAQLPCQTTRCQRSIVHGDTLCAAVGLESIP